MNNKSHKIGFTLKKIRTSKGVTQKELTKSVGISQSNYSKYEIGKVDVNSESLLSILDYLDISLQEFLYINNNYQLSEKEAILQNFFNIPFQNLEALVEVQESCKQYLSSSKSTLIQNTLILCDALLIIYRNNDFDSAKDLARPIWNRLCNNNELYVYDLYFLNAILYIFSIEEVLNIKKFLIRAYVKYSSYPRILSIFINLHINISLLLIENQLYQDALEILNEAEKLCKRKKLYFQLAIIYVRKGICINNLELKRINGTILIKKGIDYITLFSEKEALSILEKEVDLYNYNL